VQVGSVNQSESQDSDANIPDESLVINHSKAFFNHTQHERLKSSKDPVKYVFCQSQDEVDNLKASAEPEMLGFDQNSSDHDLDTPRDSS